MCRNAQTFLWGVLVGMLIALIIVVSKPSSGMAQFGFDCRTAPALCNAMRWERNHQQRQLEDRRHQQLLENQRQDRIRRQWFHEDNQRQQYQNTCSRYDPYCLNLFNRR